MGTKPCAVTGSLGFEPDPDCEPAGLVRVRGTHACTGSGGGGAHLYRVYVISTWWTRVLDRKEAALDPLRNEPN